MKLLIVFVLCILLAYFWRIGSKERVRYKNLRKRIKDRAMNDTNSVNPLEYRDLAEESDDEQNLEERDSIEK